MTFDETKVRRETDGRFGEKTGSPSDITLVGDPQLRRLLERYPHTRFSPAAGAPAEFTLQPEDIPAPLINPFKQGEKLRIPARTRIALVTNYWKHTGETEETQRVRQAAVQLTDDGGYREVEGRRAPFFDDAQLFVHPRVYWAGKDTVYSTAVTPELLVANKREVRYDEEKRERFVRHHIERGNTELRGFA